MASAFYDLTSHSPRSVLSCTVLTRPGLNRIKAPEVWDQLGGIVNTPPTSSVMVIDSGVNAAHQDLAANLVPGLTVTGYTNPPRAVSAGNAIPPLTDTNGHGTHVAGAKIHRHQAEECTVPFIPVYLLSLFSMLSMF